MNNNILVSVICAAYNHEKYIRSALDGFVMQKTNFKFEVLVHDDASTDSTADIIREYAEKYPDIIKPIFEKENQYSQGEKIARDIIFPMVQGKYIAYCEGDDYWVDSLKLQKQVDFLEEHQDYSMCACLFNEYDESRQAYIKKNNHKENFDFTIEDCILQNWGGKIQLAGVLIRSEIEKLYPRWRTECSVGDYPMFINAALHGKVRVLGEVMSVYRRQVPGSWTSRCSDNIEYFVTQHKRIIYSLQLLDIETKGQYADSIKKQIQKFTILIAVWQHDSFFFIKNFYNMKDVPYITRVSYIIQFSCPPLYKFLRSIYHLFKKSNP